MPFHGVYLGLDHTMAGIRRPIPWLWTRSCGAKERGVREAGGVRAAMRGYGELLHLGSQDCHGYLLPW